MKSVSFRAAAIVFAAICFSQGADAQTVTNIAWAKRATFNIYIPDDTATVFQVQGRITSPNFATNRTQFYIQDTNDNVGIYVYSTAFTLDTNTFKLGLEALVIGDIIQTNGVTAINPIFDTWVFYTNATITTSAPVAHTVANLLATPETYESQFVVISNVTISGTNWAAWGSSITITNSDGTGSLALRIDSTTDIDGQLPPTNAFDVKGIFTQFDSNAIPNSGYQIQPRYYRDFIQYVGQQPPSILVLATNYSATVNAPISIRILGRDRNATNTLTLTSPVKPAGATFTDYNNREGRFDWTPGIADAGTTNVVRFEVFDGTTAATATVQVVVRPASGGPNQPWINEFHYNNDSTDVGEGVELAGKAGIDLSSYYIFVYNSSGTKDSSNSCVGLIDDEGNGYGAVWFPISGMPNTVAGIALVNITNNTLLQFISYQGVLTPGVGPAAGLLSVDVGVSESDFTPVGQSLQLQGEGTNYEAFTWSGPMTATPGAINGSGQIINGAIPAAVVYSGLSLSPSNPSPGFAFDIVATITPNYSVDSMTATASYRLNGGAWSNLDMSDTGGYVFKTTEQIPAQTNGTPIDYYISTAFVGPGSDSNSPMVSATNSSLIVNLPPVFAALSNQIVTVSNSLTFSVSATDPELEPITLSISNAPAGSTFSSTNGNGDFYWTSAAPIGVYTTTFYAADAGDQSSTTITIRVSAVVMPTLVYYDFDLGTANFTNIAAFVSTQLVASVFTNDAGKASGVAGNPGQAITSQGWITTTHYFTFTLTISNGYQMSATALVFDDQRSPTGPSNWFVRCSADNYVSDLGSDLTHVSPAFASNQVFLSLAGLTNTVTFHILGTNASGGTGTWRLDNVRLRGALSPLSAFQDGIPVSWWQRYGLGPTNTAANDNDGDGNNNYEEYVGDTDPTNNASYFVYEVTNMTGRSELRLLVGPPTTNSRIYDAFYNTNLVTGPWTPYNFNVPGATNGSSFYLTVTNDAAGRFYRTGVKVP